MMFVTDEMSLKRVGKLRRKMNEMSVDAYLVTNPSNRYYLSGFTGDDGVLLVTENHRYLITDSRFEEQISHDQPSWEAIITRDYLKTACDLCVKNHVAAMAFENTISYAEYDFIDELCECDIVPLSGVIEDIRSVKSPEEIDAIKRACEMSGKGYQYVLETIRPQMTELEVSNELDYYMKKNGSEERSFETIVASGERTTWPHGTATTKKIEAGDLVTLDFGYYADGYTSDVTRTFSIGKQSDEAKKIYQIVLEAQQKTIEAVKEGVNGQELDRIGRGYIEDAGYGKYFNHGMGHGIGLDIHELPNVGRTYEEYMKAGQIITIEPGIYVPGVGGVRIEDDVLVTKNGYEILTDFSRDYTEV
ncbi:M24 family metallopeptidase [Ligilactobacillus ruminis]|uniref:M24 family metallopeptidase n=1 Tax=Ligilactobacillus ruminis TaxID=1623 RepID=UPI000659A7EF|nr:Xaa-Pro peptidase family protein [Ligilactobacillus ruminis]KLA43814.1 xaa-Pro dipeptidase [Ligilactobacillus ruminis]MCI5768678.1 Xaa-Pro peptidase family protein [Ligilactobacillus ruminis]